MTCLSCAERAKLLAEARAALASGDGAAVQRIMKELVGTAVKDFSKLRSITFVTRDAAGQPAKEQITINMADGQPESGGNPGQASQGKLAP